MEELLIVLLLARLIYVSIRSEDADEVRDFAGLDYEPAKKAPRLRLVK